MWHAYNVKRQKRNKRRNRTSQSGKNQDTGRKIFYYLEILEAGITEKIGKKMLEKIPQKNKKTFLDHH